MLSLRTGPECCHPVSSSSLSGTLHSYRAVWLLALGLACQCAQRGTGAPAAGEVRPPPIDLTQERVWPSAYSGDPLWLRASTGGDLDEARLAQRESAKSLLAALPHGGSLGRTALRSLAYAPDRREVRAELCELVVDPAPATQSLIITSIYDAIAASPETEESVDARADELCGRVLGTLAGNERLSPSDRDRARATLTLLVRRSQ
jgi:hypothetical protein